MTRNNLCLLICENYQREMESVLESRGFSDVKIFTYPALCHSSEGDKFTLKDFLPPAKARCARNVFIAGQCARYFELPSEKPSTLAHHLHEQCFYLFINSKIVDRYLKDGAYLQTPALLNRWRQCIKEMGLDQKTARKFFNKSYSSIVLLDTGIIKNISGKLKDFGKFINLPSEIVPVGLDHFRLYLRNIILEWRLERERKKHKGRLMTAGDRRAERREHERFRLNRTCLVEIDDSEMVELKDISLGGIRLHTSHWLTPDTTHLVKIYPSIKDEIRLTGKVVWAAAKEASVGSHTYETGIRFDATGDAASRSLELFFSSVSHPRKKGTKAEPG